MTVQPKRAQPVVLHIPGQEGVRAYVDAVDEGTVTLVLAVRDERRPRPHEGDPTVIEYATPSGIHRLVGSVEDEPVDEDVLRVRRMPPADEVIQRRRWARVDTAVPVEIRFHDAATGAAATVAVNLSGGGALLRDGSGLSIGDTVRMRLHLDDVLVTAAGAVVRETPAGDKGVCITHIAEADRERIVRFVAVRQREELARRRVPS